MYKLLAYLRVIAKCASFPFILIGVLLFYWQFLPTYIGRGVFFYIFAAGIIFWLIDTELSSIHDVQEIIADAKKHDGRNQTKENHP